MIDPTELHQRHWEDQDPTTAYINQQADRIAQLERERDEARDATEIDLSHLEPRHVEELRAHAEKLRWQMLHDERPAPEHGWTCFHCAQTFTTYASASAHFGDDPLSGRPDCVSPENDRFTSAGYDLDQALSEFLDFSDFETSHDPDGEKWVNMHASNWEALLSDARDARAAWSAVGQDEADDEALRERVAKAIFAAWQVSRSWEEALSFTRNVNLARADAAIRAMRGDQ